MHGARLAVAAVLMGVATTASAQEYSAVVVAHNSLGQSRTIKVFASRGKIRVEPQGVPSYEILDTTKNEGYFVVPAKKILLVQPPDMALHNGAPYAVPANPCAKISDKVNVATCKNIGTEKVDGRMTEKWQVSEGDAKLLFTTTIWVDRGLDTIVRSQSARGTMEFQSLNIGPQPASLFVVPQGYTMQKPTLGAPAAVPPPKG